MVIIAVRDHKISAGLWDGIVEEYNWCSRSWPPRQIAALHRHSVLKNVTFHDISFQSWHDLSRAETQPCRFYLDPQMLLYAPNGEEDGKYLSAHLDDGQRCLCAYSINAAALWRVLAKRHAAILKCSPLIIKCLLIILWFRAQGTHLLERLPHFPGEIEKGNFTH